MPNNANTKGAASAATVDVLARARPTSNASVESGCASAESVHNNTATVADDAESLSLIHFGGEENDGLSSNSPADAKRLMDFFDPLASTVGATLLPLAEPRNTDAAPSNAFADQFVDAFATTQADDPFSTIANTSVSASRALLRPTSRAPLLRSSDFSVSTSKSSNSLASEWTAAAPLSVGGKIHPSVAPSAMAAVIVHTSATEAAAAAQRNSAKPLVMSTSTSNPALMYKWEKFD